MKQGTCGVLVALLLGGVGGMICCAPTVRAATLERVQDDAATRQYLAANGLLNRGHNELAAQEYEKFLKAYPRHDRADHARYGLAVARVRLSLHEEAIEPLQQLIDKRDFEFAPEVGLLLGQSRMMLGQFEEAIDPLETVVRHHAEHELADDATAFLIESRYRHGAHDEVSEPGSMLADRWPDSPLRARAELFLGLSAAARDDYAAAAEHFQAVLDRDPAGPFANQATLLLARSHQQQGDLEAASRQYRKAIDSRVPALMADARYHLAAIVRQQGDLDEAAELLDEVIDAEPAGELLPLSHLERGRVHFDNNEFDDAIDQFESASSHQPIADQAAYWTAKSEMRLQRFEDAAERLNDAINTHANSELIAEMRYDRGIALVRADRPRDAVNALETFRQAHPDHDLAADALHLVATTTHQLGDYEESARFCEVFARSHNEHGRAGDVAFLFAENAFLEGAYETAAGRYRTYLEAWPDHAQADAAMFRLGTAYSRLDDPANAVRYLERVTNGSETHEQFTPALRTLGEIHFRRSEWAEAENRFEQYLDYGHDQPAADDALLKLGLARHRQQKYEDAVIAYDTLLKAFDESPHRLQAHFETGQAYVALGLADEARSALETVTNEGPESRFAPHAWNHLGALAMNDEDFERAAECYAHVAASSLDASTVGEAMFQQGQALMARESYDGAVPVFAALVEQHPNHERAALARANEALALARLQRHEEAIAAITSVMDDHADDLPADLLMSLAYEQVWAQRSTDAMDDAKETYRFILESSVQPDSSSADLSRYARIELAELEAADDAHEVAIELLSGWDEETVSRLDDEMQARVLYRLGASQYELQRYKDAAATFQRFLNLDTNDELELSAALLAGESNFRTERFERAVEQFRFVASESSDEAQQGPALLRLGESLAALHRWDDSAEAFRTHLSEHEDSALWFQARFGLGFALENVDEFDEAISQYQRVVDRHSGPTAARAQFQIGESLFAQNKYDEAVRELLKVDILYGYPEWSAAALYEAGRCFEAMAQTGQAKKYFQQVRDEHGDTRWAALAADRLGKMAGASPPGRGDG